MSESKILNVFVSFEHPEIETREMEELLEARSLLFRDLIWGKSGLAERMSGLSNKNYGKDLQIILFQFRVFASVHTLNSLSAIEKYRSREKAIGVNIFVTDDFFDKEKHIQVRELELAVVDRLHDLEVLVREKALDTKMEKLIEDVLAIFPSDR